MENNMKQQQIDPNYANKVIAKLTQQRNDALNREAEALTQAEIANEHLQTIVKIIKEKGLGDEFGMKFNDDKVKEESPPEKEENDTTG